MKRSIHLYIFATILFTGCTKNFTQKNTDPNQFLSVSPEATIESAIRSLNNQMVTYNSTKFWDLSNQIITGSRYDVTDGGMWQTAYVSVLQNLHQIEINYGNDTLYNNRVQITRILKCYTYSILTGIYGPIPINQANNPDYLSSVLFGSEDSAYAYILANLKDAASRIKPAGDKLSYDIVYPTGSVTNWIKFANTLRLKIALRCQRNLGAVATAHIQDVMMNEANTISSETDAAKMSYENVTNNYNPNWTKYVQPNNVYPFNPTSTNPPPKMADNLQAFFRSYNDPRMTVLFDSVPPANRYIITDTLTSTADDSLRIVTYPIPYLGQPASQPGILASWVSLAGLVNPIGSLNNKAYSNLLPVFISNPARPITMLGYSETLFMKAEAAILGYGGSKTAEQYYTAGIDANLTFWGITSTAATTYKNTNGIKFGTAGAGFNNFTGLVNFSIPTADINKIWIQTWMSYFLDESFDAWCLERRTRFFTFAPNTNPGGNSSYTVHPTYMDIPGRGSYPNSASQSIQTLNPNGYQSALQALGVTRADDYDPDQPLHFAAPYTMPNWTNPNAFYDLSYLMKWYGTTIQSLKTASAAGGFTYKLVSTYHP